MIHTSKLLQWHKALLWLGGATIMLFALSGVTHPIMTWTGPQAVTARPPALNLTTQQLNQALTAVQQQAVQSSALLKIVPYQHSAVIQITTDATTPRAYLGLDNAPAPTDRDVALWLASHYSGLAAEQAEQVHFQTQFDDAYPSVNRLLPVWQITYDNGLSLYVHTETLALAGITNPYKTRLQGFFRQAHSWQWLDALPWLKAIVMTILLGSALLLVLSGAWLLLRLPYKARRRGLRRWHYALSWLVILPLTLYLLTGIYHFAYKYAKPDTLGLTLQTATPLPSAWQMPELTTAQKTLYNSATLVQGAQTWYWRLSEFNPAQHADRQSRFAGQAAELQARFIPLTQDAPVLDDQTFALLLAERLLGLPASAITQQQLISRFGPDYDFRNKRLPVWQLDYASGRVFVDTLTGQLIEQQHSSSKWERYSFSFIHKWGILQPLLGRDGRDQVVVGFMVLVLLLAVLGFAMRLKRRA
ncbi:hypothetical protein [Alishewanella longhuensis]